MDLKAHREALQRGLDAHRAGKLLDALTAYRAALTLNAEDVETLSLLGLALTQSNQPEEGLALLRRAASRDPSEPGILFNLAQGLLRSGESSEAVRVLSDLVRQHPNLAAAWSKLGELEFDRGDPLAATLAWSEAMEIDPTAARPIARLAELAMQHGNTDASISLLEVGLSLNPTHPELLATLCEVFARRREWSKLAGTARAWVDGRPDEAQGYRYLSRAAFELGKYQDAVHAYSHFLMHGQHGVDDLSTYAGLCLRAQDFTAAETALEAAEEINPSHPETLARRALLLMYRGQFDAATESAKRCLEQQPNNVSAYTVLSRIRHGRLDAPELAHLDRIVADNNLPHDLRIPAAFCIAHALDANDDIDSAFNAYSRAHELSLQRDQLEGFRYDHSAEETRTHELIELFSKKDDSLCLPPIVPRRPIFVLGMPRSGSTLIESVLAAHSRVHACGERGGMQRILGNFVAESRKGKEPDPERLRSWATAYLAEPAAPADRDVITDKQPLNFHAVGLIARLFPDAVIIHIRRKPLDTLLSIWRQEFDKSWAFTHSLDDLGHYFLQYARLMAHWQTTLPGRIVTVHYEDFAANFETSAQQLLQNCGLDWEPAVLKPSDNDRPIVTFSAVTVREPVALRTGRAELYGAKLAPLISALRRAGVDPETGNLITTS